MLIPYSIAAYKRGDLPAIVLQNLYVEKAESVPGNVVLFPRPALKPREVLGAGPTRGLYYKAGSLNSALFALSGTTLYNAANAIGTIPGAGLVSMSNADSSLLIANGTALYISDGTAVSQVDFPDADGVVAVAYLGGYSIAIQANSRHIYFTLDATTWDGLDFISAEQSTASIVGICIVVDQLWVFCTDHTEIFYLSGDSTAPLERVQGRVFDKGALTRDSIVRLDNTAFWVGSDGIVYRGENTPLRISDHGIEERIAQSDPEDISAWAYPWKGHLFYVLHLSDGTTCYDPATQQWHDLASYGLPRWRALTGVQYGTAIIAGDAETGQLWTLVDGTYSDDGDPLVRIFTVQINDAAAVANLALDCSTGQLPDPNDTQGLIELRTSRDGGMTWLPWVDAGLGAQGVYRTYARWRRLGIVDTNNSLIQIRISDPIVSRISNVRLNDNTAGRSR